MRRIRALSGPGARSRVVLFAIALALVVLLVPAGAAVAAPDLPPAINVAPDAYEIDNTLAAADPITVGGPIQQHTIHTPTDSDWVKFQVRDGATYCIDTPGAMRFTETYTPWDQLPDAWVYVEIVKPNGEVIAYSQGRGMDIFRGASAARPMDIGGGNEQVVWKSAYTGTAYARVSPVGSWYSYYEGRGRYNLRARNVLPAITGTVTNELGEPMRNVVVYASPSMVADSAATGGPSNVGPALPTLGTAITDSNGDYVLYDLDPGEYEVGFDPDYYGWFYDRSYKVEFFDDWHEGDDGAPTPVTVAGMLPTGDIDAQLEVRPAQISGRVVDEDGNPMGGAYVLATIDSMGWSYGTYADADGNYEFRGITQSPGYTFRISASENDGDNVRFSQTYWNDGAQSAPMGGSPDYIVPGSYDITVTTNPVYAGGTVTDEDGQPLQQVRVSVYNTGGGYLADTYTNADGEWGYYRSTGVSETIRVQFDEQLTGDYATEWYQNAADHASATDIEAGPSGASVEATMGLGAPVVSGVVTDQITGLPIDGVQVWLWGWAGTWYPVEMAFTDEDGFYSFQHAYFGAAAVQFVDGSGVYMPEYFDDAPTVALAAVLSGEDGADTIADAELLAQGDRIYGADRYGAAAAIAKSAYPAWTDVNTVVIASGVDAAQADALTAGSLTWAYDAPMLLARPDFLPSATREALEEITAKTGAGNIQVLVVGGPASVGDAVLTEIETVIGGSKIRRISGPDRYSTARAVANEAHEVALDRGADPEFAIVANGADPSKFFDALSASAISAKTGAPILLVKAGSVPAHTANALTDIDPAKVYVVGGTSTVSNSVYSAVGASERWAGPNRYATSVNIAKAGIAHGWLNVFKIGLAAKTPDALTGGANIGHQGGPLLITAPTYLPTNTYNFIDSYDQLIEQVLMFGGPASITGGVTEDVNQALVQ